MKILPTTNINFEKKPRQVAKMQIKPDTYLRSRKEFLAWYLPYIKILDDGSIDDIIWRNTHNNIQRNKNATHTKSQISRRAKREGVTLDSTIITKVNDVKSTFSKILKTTGGLSTYDYRVALSTGLNEVLTNRPSKTSLTFLNNDEFITVLDRSDSSFRITIGKIADGIVSRGYLIYNDKIVENFNPKHANHSIGEMKFAGEEFLTKIDKTFQQDLSSLKNCLLKTIEKIEANTHIIKIRNRIK